MGWKNIILCFVEEHLLDMKFGSKIKFVLKLLEILAYTHGKISNLHSRMSCTHPNLCIFSNE